MRVNPFRLDNSTVRFFIGYPEVLLPAFGERAALTIPSQYRPPAHPSPGGRALLVSVSIAENRSPGALNP